MDDENYRHLTKKEIDDFIMWFQNNFTQSSYLNSDILRDILTNNVNTNSKNKYVFFNDEVDEFSKQMSNKIHDMLTQWKTDQCTTTVERVQLLRDKFSIEENTNKRNLEQNNIDRRKKNRETYDLSDDECTIEKLNELENKMSKLEELQKSIKNDNFSSYRYNVPPPNPHLIPPPVPSYHDYSRRDLDSSRFKNLLNTRHPSQIRDGYHNPSRFPTPPLTERYNIPLTERYNIPLTPRHREPVFYRENESRVYTTPRTDYINREQNIPVIPPLDLEKVPKYEDESNKNNIGEERRKTIIERVVESINSSDNINMKNINKNDKNIEDNYSSSEYNFFIKLNEDEKDYYLFIERVIREYNKSDIPLRFKILDKEINIENKAIIVKKIDENNKSRFGHDGENSKFNNWLNGLLKIPFGEYKSLPINKENTKEEICNYLIKSKKILDDAVYGHQITKNQIIQLITQWITNPKSGGNVIGLQGPMGNGKTTLVKEGISKAVDIPFTFITLGGCSDSAFLEGHNYTYEGSTWGKIVDVLIQTECMNPIIYFDELDKVSGTKRGDEIINMLIHLTDSTQNCHFQDKYFSGIDIDLSKSIFIFSYNDESKINPILLDRLLNIRTKGFNTDDKIVIANEYLIPNILKLLGMEKDIVDVPNNIIKHIIEKYTNEEGVRTLKKCLELIYSKLNVLILTDGTDIFSYDIKLDKFPVIIDEKITDVFLEELFNKEISKEPLTMFA